jgi:hypothetical protein
MQAHVMLEASLPVALTVYCVLCRCLCSVLCRYYLQGACAFGDKCRFSHSKEQDEPSQV